MAESTNPVEIVIEHPAPEVSLIIPSLNGYREGNVPKLLAQIKDQDFKSLEAIIVKGVRPNGRARDEGVRRAKGKYYVFIDDDCLLGGTDLIRKLIEPFEDPAKKIGMTGASYLIPDNASLFEKKVAEQLPRMHCPVIQLTTESDMVCHACLAVPASIYRETGGESRTLVSGTDPDFKARVRKAGYKIVLVGNAWVTMPTHQNLKQLCKRAYSTGKNSAFVQLTSPADVYLSTEKLGEELTPRSLPERILHTLRRCFQALLKGHWLFLIDRICYAAGYATLVILNGVKDLRSKNDRDSSLRSE
jgi:GT2 family glycosyltransferase